MVSSRSAALDTLVRFDRGGTHLRDALEDIFDQTPGLAPRDKAFCRDLAFGTVRRLNTLDWALNQFAESPVEKLSPQVLGALRLAAFQILFLADRVPPYAAVNESVELAKRHSRPAVASFVNGVLRSLERAKDALPWPDETADPVRALSIRHSHPAWLVRRWLDRWGPENCAALLAKNNEAPPMTVRVNTLRGARAPLLRELFAAGVECEATRHSTDGLKLSSPPSLHELPAFHRGAFVVQDEASQMVAEVLAPEPGETVVDLCAAPGGKTTHLAQRMGDEGAILSFDTDARRLQMLRQNCERLGISNVQPFLLDAREAGRRHAGAADRVLLDAPCSGLGVLRRRPDIRWNKDGKDVVETFPSQQEELIRSAALCLKPGGTLVYSTCTTEPEENEKIVEGFLAENADFRVAPMQDRLPASLAGAVTPEGHLRLWPHKHDTDGFFIARLRKVS